MANQTCIWPKTARPIHVCHLRVGLFALFGLFYTHKSQLTSPYTSAWQIDNTNRPNIINHGAVINHRDKVIERFHSIHLLHVKRHAASGRDHVSRLRPCVRLWAAIVYIRHRLLVVLGRKTDSHFTYSLRVEGWIDLDTHYSKVGFRDKHTTARSPRCMGFDPRDLAIVTQSSRTKNFDQTTPHTRGLNATLVLQRASKSLSMQCCGFWQPTEPSRPIGTPETSVSPIVRLRWCGCGSDVAWFSTIRFW